MQEGLLWFDTNGQLAEKIDRAAGRYQSRFGCRPTLCYINAADFDGQPETINGIRLRPALNIQPHHLWIGVEKGSPATK